MSSQTATTSWKVTYWIGWLLSALPSLMLLFSGSMKLLNPQMLAPAGYPEYLALTLGIVEIGCTLVYLVPRTAVLGAILLTGYLGGAIATHARVQEMQFLVPLVLGVFVWGGLFLRDPQVRALIPVRK
jgi:hypothetical protein